MAQLAPLVGALVDGKALWRVVVAALLGGAGLTVAFSTAVLALGLVIVTE